MTLAATILTDGWTVNDVLRCFPLSMDVLNRLGIDTCCGGHETLTVAAADAGISAEEIVAAMQPCTAPYERVSTSDPSQQASS